jgi:protein-tyrosine-phosphatase
VAEAIFKKFDKKDEAKSAGLQLDFSRPYVADNVKNVLREKGIEIEDEQARELNISDLEWADKIIVVSDNILKEIFPREKTEIWEIKDADEKDEKKIRRVIDEIDVRVKKLIIELNNV